MDLNYNDICICTDEPWDKMEKYRVKKITNEGYELASLLSLSIREETIRVVPIAMMDVLLLYPLSYFMFEKHASLARNIYQVGDVVCALLEKHKALTLEKLIPMIKNHGTYKFNSDGEILKQLRCLVVAKTIVVNLKNEAVLFTLSSGNRAREMQRKFSASFAAELASLSERVRFIIAHGPSVGTYRENLLQNTLKKHLPERYHVATGFIINLPRQIDILIYDRLDYAPVFREGDLVVVSPESVRAVIEVKTKITSSNLESALELLDDAAYFDDNQPPFFKGIFAFESELANDAFYQKIVDFYTDWHVQSQGGPGKLIVRPFQQLTCACIMNQAFAFTNYCRNESGRLMPVLHAKGSVSDLESQVSFFMQSLLSHLKFGGVKPFKKNQLAIMLGGDTFSKKIKDLRNGDDSWGEYFSYDQGDSEDDAVKKMESIILGAQNWLDGEDNFEASSPV